MNPVPINGGTAAALVPPLPQTSLLDQIVAEQAQVASRYMPVMTPAQSLQRARAIVEMKDLVLVEGVDYGVIPGTEKPTLLKPGAEKICSFFGYVPQYSILPGSIEDWNGGNFGEPLFYYHVSCDLQKDGKPVGSGTGSCSTWERKYRYRASKRTCPACGGDKLIKGKPEWEKGEYKTRGSFICYEKKGGCGAKYFGDEPAIMNQPLGEVANPDFADIINTVQKMADKRAYVAATLSATGASQFFTQDLEDMADAPNQQNTPVQQEQVAQKRIAEEQQEAGSFTEQMPMASGPKADWRNGFQSKLAEARAVLGEPAIADLLQAAGYNSLNDLSTYEKAIEFYKNFVAGPVKKAKAMPAAEAEAKLVDGDEKNNWVPENIGGTAA